MKAGFTADEIFYNYIDSTRILDTSSAYYYQYETRWDSKGTTPLIQPYVQFKYKPNDRLTLNFGAHVQYFELSNSISAIEPRFGIQYDLGHDQLVSFKALGVTPEYIRSFEAMGYKHIDADEITGLKAQDISPEYIKSFESAGFKNVSLEDVVGAKATGVTPEYIKEMKAKGLNYDKLQKYITLKSID